MEGTLDGQPRPSGSQAPADSPRGGEASADRPRRNEQPPPLESRLELCLRRRGFRIPAAWQPEAPTPSSPARDSAGDRGAGRSGQAPAGSRSRDPEPERGRVDNCGSSESEAGSESCLAWTGDPGRWKDDSKVETEGLENMPRLMSLAERATLLREFPWRDLVKSVYTQAKAAAKVQSSDMQVVVGTLGLRDTDGLKNYLTAWAAGSQRVKQTLAWELASPKQMCQMSRPGAWLGDVVFTDLLVVFGKRANMQYAAVGNKFYTWLGGALGVTALGTQSPAQPCVEFVPHGWAGLWVSRLWARRTRLQTMSAMSWSFCIGWRTRRTVASGWWRSVCWPPANWPPAVLAWSCSYEAYHCMVMLKQAGPMLVHQPAPGPPPADIFQ